MMSQSVNAAVSLSEELLYSPISLDPAPEYSRQIQASASSHLHVHAVSATLALLCFDSNTVDLTPAALS